MPSRPPPPEASPAPDPTSPDYKGPDHRRWLSAHLYMPHGTHTPAGDLFVRDRLGPLVERAEADGRVERFFFIRYREPTYGSHVRLRLQLRPEVGLDEAEAEVRAVEAGVEAAGSLPGGGEDARPAALRWTRYEPEWDRYAGRVALTVAEQAFDASSRFALDWLRGRPPMDASGRMRVGVAAFLATITTFTTDLPSAVRLLERYWRGYLYGFAHSASDAQKGEASFERIYQDQLDRLAPQLQGAWATFAAGSAMPPESQSVQSIERYVRRMRTVWERIRVLVTDQPLDGNRKPLKTPEGAFAYLAPSYIHMTNNRMGLTVSQETYLAYALHRSLLAMLDAPVPPDDSPTPAQ